ncbi:MAG: hypothetical protein ACUVWJ_12315 [Spirochaetota bacterium]
MVKKWMLDLLTFLIVVLMMGVIYAQSTEEGEAVTAAEKEKPEFGFNMNFNIGLSSYEDIDGNQIAFQKFSFLPEFSYGKWGVGLDLTFEFDGDFNLRDLDRDGKADTWTKFSDYLYKIYYVRYGHKGEPIYGRIGAFDTYTLGHGLLMYKFKNTLFYPQVHQLGLNLDIDGKIFNFPLLGFESVVDDVLDWDIIGLRVYARPLMNIPSPLLSKLKVGASFIMDADPQEDPLTDPLGDNPKSDSVTTFGVDTELPLLEREVMSLITYADWASIGGKGSGAMLGSTFTYGWFDLIAQLRFFGKHFVYGYFDQYYERERPFKYDSLDAITKFYIGYLLGTDMSLFNFINFYFYWEDGFNDPYGPRIQTGVMTVENAIPKFDVSFSYDKKDIDSFKDFFSTEDSLIRLVVAYRVTTFAKIVFTQQRTFTPSGKSTSQTFVETQFSF